MTHGWLKKRLFKWWLLHGYVSLQEGSLQVYAMKILVATPLYGSNISKI